MENNVLAVVSGSTQDPNKQPDKKFYSIRDFHEKRRYQGGIPEFANLVKGVIFGVSLSPIGINCGDGALIQQFTDEQKRNIKNNKLIEKNDIILLTYERKKDGSEGLKSRRFISLIDLSQSEDDLRKFVEANTPEDKGLNKCERVNEETINGIEDGLMLRIMKKKKYLLEKYDNMEEYRKHASNYILS